YLSRFFNQEKQMTFFDYVNNLRVEHAVDLLQKSNLRLNVIAEQSGFNSISTFRRFFAAKQQCTPSEYRKRFLK
ncbi:helix-turn-helix transcriptional regulator, partial [Prevotella copri]|uniref:helix-turn-helix domain-containing protein n=1 Tax=Segatella copri TaxID=165179 RepID=UPI001C38E19B